MNEPVNKDIFALSVRSLAERLECSPRHVERMCAAGKLPSPIRMGRAKRWSVDEIKRWIAAGAPDRRTWNAMNSAEGVP